MSFLMISKFKTFREHLFSCFTFRADATMELLDALSSNINAKHVVELSLSPVFRRTYNSIHDAVDNFNADIAQKTNCEALLVKYCPPLSQTRPYHLFVLDCTPAPRIHAKTLEDRGFVYAPTAVPGNKPVTVGHQYSVLGFLPDKTNAPAIPWLLPLSTRRVATSTDGTTVGLEQIKLITSQFGSDLSVLLGDTAYSKPEFIQGFQQNSEQVLIARLHSNRVLNYQASSKWEGRRRGRGHELWYDSEFHFKDETTWKVADESIISPFETRRGKKQFAYIQAWHNILMRQKDGIPLNEYPFTVVRITLQDEHNQHIHKKAMWLMVSGKRREELNLLDVWQSYKQRYDIEHFFRFGKNRLLIDKFQTPEVEHEEAWWQIVSLSYAQLYMARELASNLPNPWEKYLPIMKNSGMVKSATQVQKSFTKITAVVGTPASAPIPRGKSPGRVKGSKQIRRIRHSIIIKGLDEEKIKAA